MRVRSIGVNGGGVVTAAAVLALSGLLLGNATPPRFVPGEVLVKFVPGTDGSAAVALASRTSPPDLAALAPVMPRFQAATGVPLRAKQVTGGQWILVSVDGEKLMDELIGKLRRRANVAEVRSIAEPPGGTRDASRLRGILARFSPGSPEVDAIAQKRTGSDAALSGLVNALEKEIGLSLKTEVAGDTTLLLHVDLGVLTLRLSEQLKALADIESAQPNNILRIR